MDPRHARLMVLAVLAGALAGCQTTRKPYHGPLIARPEACADIAFPIYFEPDSAAVTREAERMIADAHNRVGSCTVTRIDVMGLASAPGAPDANLLLSQRRAQAVSEALRRHGFGAVEPNEMAAGDINAVAASGAHRPLRRRADVSIHLASTSNPTH